LCVAARYFTNKGKGEEIAVQVCYKPIGPQEVWAPRLPENWHMKVVSLSAAYTGCIYPPGNIPVIHFFYRLSLPQGHIAAGSIMSMKNYSDEIANRTRAVLQPTAPPRARATVRPEVLCQ
jgi:hypothetical protein